MLDLKGKLAAAGLVTREEIEALEARGARGKQGKPGAQGKPGRPAKEGGGAGRAPRSGLDVKALEAAGKGERYEAIRRQVDAQRLDSPSPIPSAESEPFHFTTAGGQLSRLHLEAPLRQRLSAGEAAIIAFMSNHGLAHAVVPPALAVDVAALFPLWLRVLQGHPGAGALETTAAAAASPSATPASAPDEPTS